MSIAGMTAILAWMAIPACQFFFRKRYMAEGGKLEDLKYRTPGYPVVPILAFLINLGILVSLAFDKAQREGLIVGLVAIALCYVIHFLFLRDKKAAQTSETTSW
jgi:arginine/ornithine permease